MRKLPLFLVAFTAFCLFPGGLIHAAVIEVDFSGSNNPTLFLDGTSTPHFEDGITFTYSSLDYSDYAGIDSENATYFTDASGSIYGTVFGELKFEFLSPVTGLWFDFVLIDVSSEYLTQTDGSFFLNEDEGLLLEAYLGDDYDDVSDSVTSLSAEFDYTSGDIDYYNVPGRFEYSGAAFDVVTLYFWAGVEEPLEFEVANISYSPVPEPASLLVWAGIAGLGCCQVVRRKLRGSK